MEEEKEKVDKNGLRTVVKSLMFLRINTLYCILQIVALDWIEGSVICGVQIRVNYLACEQFWVGKEVRRVSIKRLQKTQSRSRKKPKCQSQTQPTYFLVRYTIYADSSLLFLFYYSMFYVFIHSTQI